MKYNIYINQVQAVELGITNTTQAIILDLIAHCSTWAESVVIDDEVYYWVARQKICIELPLLNIKPDTAYRHIKSLNEIGLIDYVKDGKKDLVKLSELGKKYIFSTMSEKNPNESKTRKKIRKNSDLNPKKLGKKSEFNSEKNPTYNTTNINNTTKDNTTSNNKDIAQQKKQAEPKSKSTWIAYANAYRNRYGHEPVRSAKVNKQLCLFVDEVGKDDAPMIAEYYLFLNDSWYQKKYHDIATLLQNAQAIRTQWLNKTNMTSQDFRMSESTSSRLNTHNEVLRAIREGEI